MRWNRSITTTVFAGLFAGLALSVAPAEAQLATRRATERALFLIPAPQSPDDSAFVVALADDVRDQMASRLRRQIVTIPSTDICRVLEESAYECDTALNPADADRLAQAMRADVYIVGSMWREDDAPVSRFRMVDVRRTGLSGWMTVEGAAGASPEEFATSILDSLEHQMEAARWARECIEERDRGDFEDAMERAHRAFAIYPNHPSAAMCAEVVSEVLRQSADSQIVHVRRAVAGDSLLSRGWERLGRLYQARGDSTAALLAFAQQSRTRPADRKLRMGVIAGAITMDAYDVARDLADEWLAVVPADLGILQLKARACVEGGLWDCALDALTQQYAIDSTLVGDSVFYRQVIGAAQSLGSTTAQLEWSAEAVRHIPGSASLWRAHASALVAEAGTVGAVAGVESDPGRADSLAALEQVYTDSAVAVYEHLLATDATDVRSALAAARLLLGVVEIDTAIPLDTARLLKGGEFLVRAVAASPADTSVLMNVAVTFYQRGSALVRARMLFRTAVAWLEHSTEYDVLGRLPPQNYFFLGLGYMFLIYEFDQEVTATQSCELVDEEAGMVARGKEAMTLGAQLAPDQANRFLQQFNTFEERIPQLRRAWCQ
ncbi:MAG: hypothetical protein V3T74_07410 [Gemmatimonadales bacterium]